MVAFGEADKVELLATFFQKVFYTPGKDEGQEGKKRRRGGLRGKMSALGGIP